MILICYSVTLVLILLIQVVIIGFEEHHFFLLIVASLTVILSILVLSAVFLELLKLISVRCSNELAIHVKDLTLWVHEELPVISFDLNSSHYHVVLEVH